MPPHLLTALLRSPSPTDRARALAEVRAAYLASGGSTRGAAQHLGVHYLTVHGWLRRYPDLSHAVDAIQAELGWKRSGQARTRREPRP
jgi:transposase